MGCSYLLHKNLHTNHRFIITAIDKNSSYEWIHHLNMQMANSIFIYQLFCKLCGEFNPLNYQVIQGNIHIYVCICVCMYLYNSYHSNIYVCMYLYNLYHSSTLKCNFFRKTKDLHILCSQYRGCWWPGQADYLEIQGARTSAATISTWVSQSNPHPAC